MIYLLDTGVLLRLFDRSDANHQAVRQCVQALRRPPNLIVTSAQNLAEFWNVSSRPRTARGGYGLNSMQVRRRLDLIERIAGLIFESDSAYDEWKRLVATYGVQGVAVHDARLVANMLTHGIQEIVTLNAKDFRRYTEIRTTSPQDHVSGSA